jgi:hypothetical protein
MPTMATRKRKITTQIAIQIRNIKRPTRKPRGGEVGSMALMIPDQMK